MDSLKSEDLQGKTIFIRCDFNVPLKLSKGIYRVADDTRIRRFLDLTFRKIHDLTEGNCRIIIGSHLGRPHKKKNHTGWDGIFNIQFVSSHFDTLIRKMYGDIYTIFPPEITDSQLKHSLELIMQYRLPLGGIKFLPNLRYLLDPEQPEIYRTEFIEELAGFLDVYINCAFGCSHRLTKSVQMLPHVMRESGKLVVPGKLLFEEIERLGYLGERIISHPEKTVVIAGGAKIADKIGILKQFVQSRIKSIFLGGKMVNAFIIAKNLAGKISSLQVKDIPKKMQKNGDEENHAILKEIKLAHEIICLAKEMNVTLLYPQDFKVVKEYEHTTFQIKECPDWEEELQLDLGPRTIANFSKTILADDVENVFWNGPLGAYDHASCDHYAEGSMEMAKSLYVAAIGNEKLFTVVGGGDSAAILNKFDPKKLKESLQVEIEKQLSGNINKNLIQFDFPEKDSYTLFNYFSKNFFVSTGGGASLEFLEHFLKDSGKSALATYLPGTAALMESPVEEDLEETSKTVAK